MISLGLACLSPNQEPSHIPIIMFAGKAIQYQHQQSILVTAQSLLVYVQTHQGSGTCRQLFIYLSYASLSDVSAILSTCYFPGIAQGQKNSYCLLDIRSHLQQNSLHWLWNKFPSSVSIHCVFLLLKMHLF